MDESPLVMPSVMAKERVSSSASLALSCPVSAEDRVFLDCSISIIEPSFGALRTGSSLAPLMLMLMVCVVPSEAVRLKESEPV